MGRVSMAALIIQVAGGPPCLFTLLCNCQTDFSIRPKQVVVMDIYIMFSPCV